MSHPTDPLFGIHARALDVWQQRAEAIAGNLANADTPDYKARDVDFRKVLAQAGAQDAPLQLAAPSPGQIGGAGDTTNGNIPLEWRVPMQPSMDGNTVDTQAEQAAYAANSVHYQATLTFITAQIQMLRTAITGGSSS